MQLIRFRWELSDSGHFVRFCAYRSAVEGTTVGGIPFKAVYLAGYLGNE
jgi:hypothetical protein